MNHNLLIELHEELENAGLPITGISLSEGYTLPVIVRWIGSPTPPQCLLSDRIINGFDWSREDRGAKRQRLMNTLVAQFDKPSVETP